VLQVGSWLFQNKDTCSVTLPQTWDYTNFPGFSSHLPGVQSCRQSQCWWYWACDRYFVHSNWGRQFTTTAINSVVEDNRQTDRQTDRRTNDGQTTCHELWRSYGKALWQSPMTRPLWQDFWQGPIWRPRALWHGPMAGPHNKIRYVPFPIEFQGTCRRSRRLS